MTEFERMLVLSREYSARVAARGSWCGMFALLLLLCVGVALPVRGQRPTLRPSMAVGLFSQTAPSLHWEFGHLVDVGVRIPLNAWIHLSPSIEMSRTTDVGQGGDLCEAVGRGAESGLPICFKRPSREVVGAMSVRLELAARTSRGWHPRAGVGVAVLRSFARPNLGERGRFVSPEAAVGVAFRTLGPVWGIELRMRRLSRWELSTHGQVALRTYVEL